MNGGSTNAYKREGRSTRGVLRHVGLTPSPLHSILLADHLAQPVFSDNLHW